MKRLIWTLGFWVLTACGVSSVQALELAYGSWAYPSQTEKGITMQLTMTLSEGRVTQTAVCTYGSTRIEVEASSSATITADRVQVLETKADSKTASGLTCNVQVKASTFNYSISGNKMALSWGTESATLTRN